MEETKSELNVGIDVASTAQKVFTEASFALSSLNIEQAFHSSGDLLRHLTSYMKPEEKDTFNQRWYALGDMVNKHLSTTMRTGTIQPVLIQKLHIFIQDLRDVFARSGMMTKLADDARKALK